MKYEKLYFVGIKGVGMANLAIVAKQAGLDVAGCDVSDEFITDPELAKEKIPVDNGFKTQDLEAFVGETPAEKVLLIATAAHGGLGNPMVQFAKENGWLVMTYGQALGAFMNGGIVPEKNVEGISITGAHGKTTISAMIATSLTLAGHDPSYVVGTSQILPIGAAGHSGHGNYFVAEADEYVSDITYDRVSKFLYQHPKYLIINNIDFDHPDFFHDIEDIAAAYRKLISQLEDESVIFVNGDDPRAYALSQESSGKIVTYGSGKQNDYCLAQFAEDGLSCTFTVETSEMVLGEFSLSVPGYHNAKNALAVIALLIELGVSAQKIQEVLPKFAGTKRRLERIGLSSGGSLIFDDYAHHPQEIKMSLSALRSAFPVRKLVVVFQPHTYSRTESLLSEFVGSFSDAETVIILPVYASAREKGSASGSVEEKMKEEFRLIRKNAHFLSDTQSVIEYLKNHCNSDEFLIVTMGAGDVYRIGEELKKSIGDRV